MLLINNAHKVKYQDEAIFMHVRVTHSFPNDL
jgi:hypothetical protein